MSATSDNIIDQQLQVTLFQLDSKACTDLVSYNKKNIVLRKEVFFCFVSELARLFHAHAAGSVTEHLVVQEVIKISC